MHRGCPQCAKGKQTSYPEQKIYYYIKKYFPDAINRYSNNDCGITELDIYIPSLCVAIEYDGGEWHQDINKDKLKDLFCENNNINLIRIRDPKCPVYDSNCSFIYLESRSLRHLADAILRVLKILGIDNPVVDFDEDLADIETLICHQTKDNSLAKLFPNIAAEWNYSKNGNLIPENVLAHSGNVSARSGRVSYGAFTFALKTLIDFIDMIPVVNTSVIIVFQLYLGNEHKPDGDADRKRQDFDKGSMAFWQKIHDDGFNRHSQMVYKMVLSTISPSKRWMTRWA